VLTTKEQRFVREYRVDGDAANAARRAGYAKASAKVTGCRLLKKPEVAAAIANHESEKANQLIADAAERRELLTGIARSGKNPVAAIKAVDILNKMDGVYVQKHEHVGPVQIVISEADARG
jgi:phage terminase small subunit